MQRIIHEKIGYEYSTVIIDGNSSEANKTLKKQLKKLSTRVQKIESKPTLIYFILKMEVNGQK